MGSPDTPERPVLSELVEPPRWQRLQDHFASVLGVPIRTVTPSCELVVNPSWPTGLDPERTIRLLRIGDELGQLLPQADPPRETSSLTTRLGVTYAIIPVWATADDIAAYFLVGPMVVGPREDELQFRSRVETLRLDAQALWPLLLSLKLYTFAGVRSALNLMQEVGTSIVEVAYQAKQLASMLPATTKVDQAVIAYHTDRILHSLLEAATLATRAEGGSVMLYSPQQDALQIKAAQGLSEDVVAATRVKRGEGLVGLAASQRRILLIDAQTADQAVKDRMRRPELVSSLVAPLVPDPTQEPVGVLNLRTSNPQRRFTQDHVELLRRLLDLAGIALGNLRLVFTQARSSLSS